MARPDSLLDGLVDGQAWAFRGAVDEFGPAVLAIASAHGLNAADRDEVFQATFLSLLEHSSRIRSEASLPAWIATVATNHCLKSLRRTKPLLVDDLATVIDLSAPRLPDLVDDDAEREGDFSEVEVGAVAQAIAALGERDAQLVRLLFAEHRYSYNDIAELLQVSPSSVGPLRDRMLNRIRKHPLIRSAIGIRSDRSA